LKHYADYFHKDSVVIFPTDTVVGLGCRFNSESAIAKIRKIKEITDKNPLAVLISSEKQLDILKIRRSPLSNLLMHEFWPGGLTLVLTSEETFPCSGERNTMGIRMPDSEFLRKIIDTVGVPLAATSANLHGRPAPAAMSEITKAFRGLADHFIEYETPSNGQPSTVVTIEGGIVRILREGAVTKKEIIDVIGDRFQSLDV
jgi:L-threonylcarbamoyladenylate synthase